MYAEADPGFQVRGGALKKIAPSGGRRENFGDISCEKSRFYAKKSYFFQLQREARKSLGYFVWKITILRQKKSYFSNFRGGELAGCFYGSHLSCFNVHAPTCPRDTIICLPDNQMASAEAGRVAPLSEEDFELNLVDQFFKLVRIVAKTCLLLIFFS